MRFMALNSVALGTNGPTMTSCLSRLHPEERTPRLWDEQDLKIHCYVAKEKTLKRLEMVGWTLTCTASH